MHRSFPEYALLELDEVIEELHVPLELEDFDDTKEFKEATAKQKNAVELWEGRRTQIKHHIVKQGEAAQVRACDFAPIELIQQAETVGTERAREGFEYREDTYNARFSDCETNSHTKHPTKS